MTVLRAGKPMESEWLKQPLNEPPSLWHTLAGRSPKCVQFCHFATKKYRTQALNALILYTMHVGKPDIFLVPHMHCNNQLDSFMTLIFQPFYQALRTCYAMLIFVTTATTCGGVLFSSQCPFSKENSKFRPILAILLRIYALFGVVLQGGSVPKLRNIRCVAMW